MQEAFVAALLALARKSEKRSEKKKKDFMRDLEDDWVGVAVDDDDGGDLDDLVLWVEIKKQIQILREGIKEE